MRITNLMSPNFTPGRKNYKPEAIVIHVMAGTLQGTDSWFNTSRSAVSAHYGIGLNGDVHAYVSETNMAWHAGRVDKPSWPLIKNAGAGLFVNPNYYTIGIEHEGSEDSEWTNDMYQTSAALIKDICTRWNIPIDRKHIIGHHEIFSLKTCPGNKADLNRLISLAGGSPDVSITNVPSDFTKVPEKGKVTTTASLNLRSQPSRKLAPVTSIAAHVQLAYDGFTEQGERIDGNAKWYFTNEGNWFWSGAVTDVSSAPLQSTIEAFSQTTFTAKQLAEATGASLDFASKFLPFVTEACEKYGIDTPARQLCFFAQVGHESGGLFYTEELASGKAYEGRLDLGNTQPGDGVRFKGRGLIQITGRANYRDVGEALGEDFLSFPQKLGGKNVRVCSPEQLRNAALSAGWFWNKHNLNNLADRIDAKSPVDEGNNLICFKQITKTINGGYNGLQDRVSRFKDGVSQFA